MAIRVTDIEVGYLYAFLSTKFEHFQSLSNGAAIPGISREDVLDLMCQSSLPPLPEQKRIVSRLNALSSETNRLQSLYQHKRTTLADLKQSLLHKAFTGALTSQSVSVLQEAVA